MKKRRASSFRLYFALLLAVGIAPALILAQGRSGIVGNWEGTLDPGAQAKKRIVVHISAAQDGSTTTDFGFKFAVYSTPSGTSLGFRLVKRLSYNRTSVSHACAQDTQWIVPFTFRPSGGLAPPRVSGS